MGEQPDVQSPAAEVVDAVVVVSGILSIVSDDSDVHVPTESTEERPECNTTDVTDINVTMQYIDPACIAQDENGNFVCYQSGSGQPVNLYNAVCDTDGSIHVLSEISSMYTDATAAGSQIAEAITTVDGSSPPVCCARKRKRDEHAWVRNKRKRLRNTGEEYFSSRNIKVKAKVFNPIGNTCCSRKCVTLITEDERREIFTKFWQLGSHSVQTAFIAGCIEQRPVATQRVHDHSTSLPVRNQSRRTHFGKCYSRQFTLSTSERCVKVCKFVFLNTLGISDGRMNRILANKRNNGGVAQGDRRGKYCHSKQKIPSDKVAGVEAHIRSFPVNVSHYTRSHSEARQYLSPNLSINAMYRLYVQKCEEDGSEPVKGSMYRHIFNTKFNLSFHSPWKDTCKKCDSLKIATEAETDSCKRKALATEHELHLRKAECVRNLLQMETHTSSVSSYEAFSFDLQKVFSLPSLTAGEAFYCRQLSMYNLGIHSLSTGKVTMNVWHEGIASRGPDEIASCLLLYCQHLAAAGVKVLSAYSDSCGGQNRNKKMALMWLYICQKYNFDEITHRFMISGHSFLPNDADFGVIERSKPKSSEIFTLEQWCKLIETCCKKNPYEVVRMTAEHFCSSSCLTENMSVRSFSETGEKVKWMSIQCLQVRKTEPTKLYYKYSVQPDVDYSCINLAKSGRRFRITDAQLMPLYAQPRVLSAAKAADIRKLLKFVPPIHHSFYEAIISQSSTESAAQHLYEDEILNESEAEEEPELQEITVPSHITAHSVAEVNKKTETRRTAATGRKPAKSGNNQQRLLRERTQRNPASNTSGSNLQDARRAVIFHKCRR